MFNVDIAMTIQYTGSSLEISRRKLLAAAGIAGGALVVASLVEDAYAAIPLRTPIEQASAPPVSGLHLQFGADASSEMVVS